jgi:hypothetical protein
MSLMSTPRHTAKLSGSYISSSAGYGPEFLQRLKEVTKGSKFWDPKAD